MEGKACLRGSSWRADEPHVKPVTRKYQNKNLNNTSIQITIVNYSDHNLFAAAVHRQVFSNTNKYITHVRLEIMYFKKKLTIMQLTMSMVI